MTKRSVKSWYRSRVARPLTILSAQVRPVAADPAATFAKFEAEVDVVVQDFPRAQLLVWPELYLTGEDPFTSTGGAGYMDEVAEPVPGPLTERVAKIASSAQLWIAAGSVFERDGDHIYNTAVVFAPDGRLVARHRKVFPWQPWEKADRGRAVTVFDIPGAGRIGLMICYEGWFPEIARALAVKGAELILQPSLTSTADREQELVLARANAIANQCFVVNVNAASTIGGGRSIACDPEGRVLFEGGGGEELITEVVDLERTELVRREGTRGLNRVWQHFLDAPLDDLAADVAKAREGWEP